MKKINTFIVSFFLFMLATSTSYAAAGNNTTTCQPIYGGGQTCVQSGNVSINKRVTHPKTGVLVDTLTINDDKFGPESTVTFQLDVTNNGGTKIGKVQVKDIFPQNINFVSGIGNFNSNSKILSFDVNDLNPNETRTFTIVGKVVPANQLPVDRGIACVINQATAKDVNASMESKDTAQLCIQKELPAPTETKGGLKVFPPEQTLQATPPTGPEMLPLLAMLPTGLIGALLRRKALGK